MNIIENMENTKKVERGIWNFTNQCYCLEIFPFRIFLYLSPSCIFCLFMHHCDNLQCFCTFFVNSSNGCTMDHHVDVSELLTTDLWLECEAFNLLVISFEQHPRTDLRSRDKNISNLELINMTVKSFLSKVGFITCCVEYKNQNH